MADDADDPLTTPNDEFHKFRFNSEVSEIGYAYEVHNYTFPFGAWSGTFNADFYLPSGTSASDCKVAGYRRSLMKGFIPIFSRMSDLPYPSYWVEVKNGAAYSSTWQTQMVPYGDGSGKRRIVSQNLRHLRTVEGIPSAIFTTNTSLVPLSGFSSQVQVLGNMDVQYAIRNHPDIHLNFAPMGSVETATTGSVERRFINWELPIDGSPYPTTPPTTPVSGHRIFLADPDGVWMSKAGYEASPSQDYDKMIFSSEKIPLKIARAGALSLTAGQEVEVTIAYPITEWADVEYQVNVQGEALRVPPLPNDDSTDIVVEYKIDTVANSVWFRNSSAVAIDMQFIVLTEDGRTTFGGTGVAVEVVEDDYAALKNPVTGEPIIDTRTQFLPMVDQDWIEPPGMVASDVAKYGSKMKVVSITNTGFKLFVLGCMVFRYDNGSYNHKVYIPLHSKKIEGHTYFTRSTFMCEINADHDEVKFYGYDGTGPARIEEDSNKDFGDIGEMIGFRYYLFAVPASL